MTDRPPWILETGHDPLVATAIHDGHDLSDEVAQVTALTDAERLREEDPFTGEWTTVARTRIVARTSRFEVDLNRPRERAVYRVPEDAWGLALWKMPLPRFVVERSLWQYDAFYETARRVLAELVQQFGQVVVLDLHTYNHRRGGPTSPPDDPAANPEVNVGTGTMDRKQWAPIVDGFIDTLRHHDFRGRHLDVRENVRFRGGQFPRWIHESFPDSVCCLAVEFKKFFMDEWTGQRDPEECRAILGALQSATSSLRRELEGARLRD